MTNKQHHQSNWFGFILITVGVLFLLETFNIMDFGDFFSTWWPLVFIAIGLIKLKDSDKTSAIIFLIMGTVFLLTSLGIVSWGRVWRLWPVVLIFVGLKLIFKGRSTKWNFISSNENSEDTISASAIFGGVEQNITSKNFKGGEITAVFGGSEIDLRDAQISPEGCDLKVTALFGGAEITVPANTRVVVSGTPIFGSVENKARIVGDTEPDKVINIHCTVAFGGVEIK